MANAKPLSLAIEAVSKPITGGTLESASRSLGTREKAWGKVATTITGDYTIQVMLPDKTVHTLATVAAVVPVGHVARIDTRTYVNVVRPSGEEGGD